MNLYVTADVVDQKDHGGGQVTGNEAAALRSLGECLVLGRNELYHTDLTVGGLAPIAYGDPWGWDQFAQDRLFAAGEEVRPRLAHFYAGTFSGTVRRLKGRGTKISYTAAAHSIEESRKEHETLGVPYDYPHMTDPDLWERYLEGYLLADRLIVPSSHSRDVMVGYGADPAKVVLIPHGVTVPDKPPAPLPARFTVGYLGAVGPDKGIIYLLQAWKRLAYPDATLRIAGRDSTSPYVRDLVSRHGGGNVELVGWVPSVWDFMDSLSLYVQPSVSEGFGIEVLEALVRGRPVVCSKGAGACDVIRLEYDPTGSVVPARDADGLASAIGYWKDPYDPTDRTWESITSSCRGEVLDYSWDKIRRKYAQVWEELLS